MLSDNLIMLRRLNNYSQEEISEKIGISRQAYAKWESGATIPDIEKCRRLAEIYGITLDSMININNVEGIGILPPPPRGKRIWGTVTLNDRGQLVIPKPLRDFFNLNNGKRLVLLSDETGIAMVPAEMFEALLRELSEYASHTIIDN